MAHAAALASDDRSVDLSVLDLARLDQTPLHTDPFDFIVVEQFIKPPILESVLEDYPAITGPGNFKPEAVRSGPHFQALLDDLTSEAMKAAFARKFGMDLDAAEPSIGLRGFSEATDGNVHTDQRSKILTVLLYFNREWPHAGGALRMCRPSKDVEDYTVEVPPLAGTMLAFRRSDTSFHGHKPHVGARKMLQMSYVEPSMMHKINKQFSRMSKPVRRMFNVS